MTGHNRKGSKLDQYDPDKLIHIRLVETETNTIVDLPAVSVSIDYPDEASETNLSNIRYSEVISYGTTFNF
jgi:hypothetical protein